MAPGPPSCCIGRLHFSHIREEIARVVRGAADSQDHVVGTPTAILDEVGVATRERGREQRAVRVGGRLALGPDDGDGWLIRPNRLRSLDTQHGLLADQTPLPHRAAHNRSYLIPAARMSAAGTPASRKACLGMFFRLAYPAAYFTKFFLSAERSRLVVFASNSDSSSIRRATNLHSRRLPRR